MSDDLRPQEEKQKLRIVGQFLEEFHQHPEIYKLSRINLTPETLERLCERKHRITITLRPVNKHGRRN